MSEYDVIECQLVNLRHVGEIYIIGASLQSEALNPTLEHEGVNGIIKQGLTDTEQRE